MANSKLIWSLLFTFNAGIALVAAQCPAIGINYWGNDIEGFKQISNTGTWDDHMNTWQECARYCKEKESSGCKYWAWHRHDNSWYPNHCWLKSSNAGSEYKPDIISGAVTCTDPGCPETGIN